MNSIPATSTPSPARNSTYRSTSGCSAVMSSRSEKIVSPGSCAMVAPGGITSAPVVGSIAHASAGDSWYPPRAVSAWIA